MRLEMLIRKCDVALPVFEKHVVLAGSAVVAEIVAHELADLEAFAG